MDSADTNCQLQQTLEHATFTVQTISTIHSLLSKQKRKEFYEEDIFPLIEELDKAVLYGRSFKE